MQAHVPLSLTSRNLSLTSRSPCCAPAGSFSPSYFKWSLFISRSFSKSGTESYSSPRTFRNISGLKRMFNHQYYNLWQLSQHLACSRKPVHVCPTTAPASARKEELRGMSLVPRITSSPSELTVGVCNLRITHRNSVMSVNWQTSGHSLPLLQLLFLLLFPPKMHIFQVPP